MRATLPIFTSALLVAGEAILLDHYAKELFEEYLALLRAEDGPRHRLSVDVMRAARADGRSLDEFVTALIGIGLAAYQAMDEAA
jgi:hypothetical protein